MTCTVLGRPLCGNMRENREGETVPSQTQRRKEGSELRAYLSKSCRFFGEGHSSWKLVQAHTLAWLSTRSLKCECTCRTVEEGRVIEGQRKSLAPEAHSLTLTFET